MHGNKYFAVIVAEFDEINNCALHHVMAERHSFGAISKAINGLSAAARRRR
jgi:hypothetical protein